MINDKVEQGESVVAVLQKAGQPDRTIVKEEPALDENPFEVVVTVKDKRTGKTYQYEVKG